MADPEKDVEEEETGEGDTAAAAKPKKGRRHNPAQVKEWQKKLNNVLREPELDSANVRTYMEISMQYDDCLDPNYIDTTTLVSTLHTASYQGEVEIVEWCIEAKADVNQRTALGRSPLHFACDGNKPRVIRLLLKKNADANMRTLSQSTPLHLCCQYGSYDAVLMLLHETDQVIDIDAEDTRRKTPEALTTDKSILRTIKKYRSSFDEKRQQALVEQQQRNLFELFNRQGENSILPEELAESKALLAKHLGADSEQKISEIFEAATKNPDGKVNWEEFKAAHTELISSAGLEFRDLMAKLGEIETVLLEEKIRLKKDGKEDEAPLVSAQAKQISEDRKARLSAAA